MLRFLNQCSRGRGAWLLMALTAFALEMVALWFQHVMGLKPCVLCIYERCALFGIMGAGLVGAIAPKTPLRYVGIAIWLYSAWKGIELSWQHTMMQLHHGVLPGKLNPFPGAVQPDGNTHIAQRRFWGNCAHQACTHNAEQRAALIDAQHAGLESHHVLEPQRDHFQRKGGQGHQ